MNSTMETTIPGIFACGNVVHVHDLVDFVSAEGERAGKNAAFYVNNKIEKNDLEISIENGQGITYTVPQIINGGTLAPVTDIFMRVNNVYKNKRIVVKEEDKEIISFPRKHLAPGEMEKISIPEKFLKDVKGKLTIELQEGK